MAERERIERPELTLPLKLTFDYSGWQVEVGTVGVHGVSSRGTRHELSAKQALRLAQRLGPEPEEQVRRTIALQAAYAEQQFEEHQAQMAANRAQDERRWSDHRDAMLRARADLDAVTS